jgi:putative zinc finger/helix-turn-helix YgiT family protein
METNKFIKKVKLDCPLCDQTHEVEERERLSKVIIKGEEVTYPENYYFCSHAKESENEFVTGAMANRNLLNARNAYRVKKGLLTSDDIVAIRESYDLSQVDLAKLLGWGEATISRYESKAIQDESYDLMLRLIRDNPMKALELLKRNRHKFTEKKYNDIKGRIVEKLDSYGKEYLTRQPFEAEYTGFEDKSEMNGYALLNIDKIEAMVSYFAEKTKYLYKVKLMKMLWYADVLAYNSLGHAMSGIVYRHEPMGALPIGHEHLVNLERLNIKEEESYNYNSMFHIYPVEGIDYSVLSQNEKAILDEVIKKFMDWKAIEIVEYMHEEKAYKETCPGAIIPFNLTKDIKHLM